MRGTLHSLSAYVAASQYYNYSPRERTAGIKCVRWSGQEAYVTDTPAVIASMTPSAYGVAPVPNRAAVLMVDDQPARLLTYESILHGLNVDCVRALSADEALASLLKQEFAAILLDVEMPQMDGFALARLIREHPRLERTPILFVTGVHLTEIDRLKGYEVGAIDYIAVPVVPEILRSKVAVLVELYQRRRQLQDLNRELQKSRAPLLSEAHDPSDSDPSKLRAAFDNPCQVSLILGPVKDRSGEIVDWIVEDANTTAASLFGRAREDLLGQRLTAVLRDDRSPAVIAQCAEALVTQAQVQSEHQLRAEFFSAVAYAAGPECVVWSATDIGKQRSVESALRGSEAKYRALIENAPVGVAHNALDGRFLFVNRAFCELVGYSADELRSMTWQQITDPEDVGADQALANSVLSHEIAHYTVQKRYIRKDGSRVWVELFGSFVFDETGAAFEGVAIAVDITMRRAADRALRESQESLVLAKNAARLGTFDWDVRTDTLVWDERTHEIWGIEPNGPMKVAEFFSQVHPDDHEAARRAIEKSFDVNGDRVFAALYRVINRIDGVTRWVEASGRVYFRSEQPARMIGVVRDVTERILAEQQLAESEQRFRELANNIDQFAWTIDAGGRALWYNDRWYDYTGTTFEQLQGDGWKRVHHPDHIERFVAHFKDCLATGQPWEDTFPLRGKDGAYRWFLSRAIPIRDVSGNIVRWFGTNTDVTELRQLQDALKENDRRKDEFLAMLAHELRNPVAPIRNAAEVLKKLSTGDNEQKLVAIIARQTTHLAHLLDDLLDVARITAGHIELVRELIPLESCIESAVESVEPLMRQRGHHLRVSSTFVPCYLNADKVRITQCIANLLANAAKFTPTGGVIHVSTRREGNDAVVDITDSGIGIAPEFLPRMFDLFAQAERSADRSQGGLGIGLTVCKRLLEMHGGSISASSKGLGNGATFTIRIPFTSASDGEARVTGLNQRSRRVLIVDDNRDAADSLALLLRFSNH